MARAKIGRPRKWKDGTTMVTLSVPVDYRAVWDKADELAIMENISRAEIITRALVEYEKLHLEGNPQIPSLEFQGDKIDAYLDKLAQNKLTHFLQFRTKYPTSPIMESETVKVLAFTKRVRRQSPETDLLVDKVIDLG